MPALLCLVAHPDDETRLCGGLLAKLAAQGIAVHVLCLTRGEGGELGEPPLATRETLGQVRERELSCAVQALGLQGLTILDYVDPPVGPGEELSAPEHDPAELTAQFIAAIERHRPEVVLTHGSNGEYGHPAHLLVHGTTRAAVAALGEAAPLLYSFAASYPDHPYPRLSNADDPAHFVVDTSTYSDKIEAAAQCHRTQHALFGRRQSQELGRPVSIAEVVRLVPAEGVHRHWPPAAGRPDDIMHAWLAA